MQCAALKQGLDGAELELEADRRLQQQLPTSPLITLVAILIPGTTANQPGVVYGHVGRFHMGWVAKRSQIPVCE